jgi:hypothetical protein
MLSRSTTVTVEYECQVQISLEDCQSIKGFAALAPDCPKFSRSSGKTPSSDPRSSRWQHRADVGAHGFCHHFP